MTGINLSHETCKVNRWHNAPKVYSGFDAVVAYVLLASSFTMKIRFELI
jgi:hypothetical protein